MPENTSAASGQRLCRVEGWGLGRRGFPTLIFGHDQR